MEGKEYEFYNLLSNSLFQELQFNGEEFFAYLDRNRIRFC